ncbi:hypothetical protein D3C85_107780 [compost metagenome]
MSENDINIVHFNPILIPVGRILRDYWHLEPYLLEHEVSLRGLAELSFSISDLHLANNPTAASNWTVMSIIEDHFLCNVKASQNLSELSDDDAIALHNLTNLAHEIHMLITDMVRQYTLIPGYGFHPVRKWIGDNILIESYR